MARRTPAAVVAGAVLAVITACASPGAGAPSESAGASATVTQSAENTEGENPDGESTDPSATESAGTSTPAEVPVPGEGSVPTDITATQAAPSAGTGPAPEAGAEPWPPKLVFSEILEAGTTQVSLGKVTLTLPAGFAHAGGGSYTSSWPSASGPAKITITQSPAEGSAGEALAEYATWARSAPVSVPNASSAAMADAVIGGIQTWGLAIVDSSGTTTIATFEAAPKDFQDYLIYQSVVSVVVAA